MSNSNQFSDLLNDPTVAAEIMMHENPQLAGRQGLDTQLFEQGVHEPAGATIVVGDLDIKTKVKASRDFGAKASRSSEAAMYIEFGGHKRDVEQILSKAAATRGLETIVRASDNGIKKKALTEPLTRREMQSLADLGATIYSAEKSDITPQASSKTVIRRSPKTAAPRFDAME